MPERLFVCTPSRLGTYADCPRRYRYSYVDRPAPQKGPPWAHNSLGASVHTALKNWYALPTDRRRPEAMAALLKGVWVRDGYRDDEQERAAFRRASDWLESYVGALEPGVEPLGVERVVAVKTSVLAFNGRADRIDSRTGPDGPELAIVDYKTGRSGLDADDARGSQALALYAYAAERVFRRPCRRVELHHLPTGTVAAHDHTAESLARQVSRAEAAARDIMAAERAVADGGDPDEAFPTTPGTLCGWCDYRRTCPDGSQVDGKEPWASVERTLTDPTGGGPVSTGGLSTATGGGPVPTGGVSAATGGPSGSPGGVSGGPLPGGDLDRADQ